jgi:outer membrane protein OmpA-like peptidoglycan-associated protein
MTHARHAGALAAAVALLVCCAPSLAGAQGLTNFSGRDPGVQDIIRALKPAEPAARPAATGVRTRAIRLPGQQTVAANAQTATEEAASEADAQPQDAGPRKASFDQIQFRFDSAELTPAARRMLDRIGEALASDDLKGMRFVVEGHTDAVGPDEYNLALSQRRAETVQRYLTSRYGIAPRTLVPLGKGEQDLLDADAPASPVNRRVVIGAMQRP